MRNRRRLFPPVFVHCYWVFLTFLLVAVGARQKGVDSTINQGDWRDILNGVVVANDTSLGEYYNCQDIVLLPPTSASAGSSRYVATFSHARSEGGSGERAYTCFSSDSGNSWSALQPVEDSLTLVSHGSALISSSTSERVFVVYNYNIHNTGSYPDGTPLKSRVDMLGEGFFFRYSDDGGLTWSSRFNISFAPTDIDRANPWHGKNVFLMHIDAHAPTIGSTVFLPFTKMSTCCGETTPAQPFLLASHDLLTAKDPSMASWIQLPDGDEGLSPPDHSSQMMEENHIVYITNYSRLHMLWRSDTGKIGCTYSSNAGHSWEPTSWMAYDPFAPVPHIIKNPRGSVAHYRKEGEDGKFVLLFYNNGLHNTKGRSVLWVSGGLDVNGYIYWSQPEVALYDANFTDEGPGYVGFLEDHGQIKYLESPKHDYVRLHTIDSNVLDLLWHQKSVSFIPTGEIMDLRPFGPHLSIPTLPSLQNGGSFSLVLWVQHHLPLQAEILLQCDGFAITINTTSYLPSLHLLRGLAPAYTLTADKFCAEQLWNGLAHQIVVVIDGLANIGSVVVDGVLCDGGTDSPQGWKYLDDDLDIVKTGNCFVAQDAVLRFRVYPRYFLTTEAIASWRRGP